MAKAKDDKPIETGSVLGRTLQEKQVAALDKARKALESSVDGYTSIIEKLNNELNDVYYKIQEKETLLKEIERDQVSQRLATVEELDNKITQLEKSFDTKIKDFQVTCSYEELSPSEYALYINCELKVSFTRHSITRDLHIKYASRQPDDNGDRYSSSIDCDINSNKKNDPIIKKILDIEDDDEDNWKDLIKQLI